jgi:hypothetical protein
MLMHLGDGAVRPREHLDHDALVGSGQGGAISGEPKSPLPRHVLACQFEQGD